jgi:hypothetical protein
MDEHEESGLTDYQLRFLLRELLAYAEQAPDKDAIVKHLEELLRDGENDWDALFYRKVALNMTNQRFDELFKQIKDYAEECNDAQKIIQYLDKLMEDVRSGKKVWVPQQFLLLSRRTSQKIIKKDIFPLDRALETCYN